MDKLSISLMG